jgi:hypothetical protein
LKYNIKRIFVRNVHCLEKNKGLKAIARGVILYTGLGLFHHRK